MAFSACPPAPGDIVGIAVGSHECFFFYVVFLFVLSEWMMLSLKNEQTQECQRNTSTVSLVDRFLTGVLAQDCTVI